MPEPLEARDQRAVEHGDLAVEHQRGRAHGPYGGRDGREALSVVAPVAADELHCSAVLVGQHPPAVHLLFVDPALAVEREGDQRGLRDADGGYHCFHYSEGPAPGGRRVFWYGRARWRR